MEHCFSLKSICDIRTPHQGPHARVLDDLPLLFGNYTPYEGLNQKNQKLGVFCRKWTEVTSHFIVILKILQVVSNQQNRLNCLYLHFLYIGMQDSKRISYPLASNSYAAGINE